MIILKSMWAPLSCVGVAGEAKSQIALVRPKLDVVASRSERGTTRSTDVTSWFEGNIRSVFEIVSLDWEGIA